MNLKIFIAILGAAQAAPTIDLKNLDSLKAQAKLIQANILSYYKPGTKFARLGTIADNPAEDATGFQWYEGGVKWGAMMEYIRMTGDKQPSTLVVNGLTMASSGKVGSFLGADKVINGLAGRWNDDIGWWALAALTGGEIFGKDVMMPGGVTYYQLVQSTYDDIWAQYDDKCGGGIYWNRNRQDSDIKKKYYKSSITNSQHINMGARLYLLTKNQTYLQDSMKIFNWVKDTVITKDFKVVDGLQANQTCSLITFETSYNAGYMAGALAWLYKASNDQKVYEMMNNVGKAAVKNFVYQGIIRDYCEPKCPQNQATPKGTHIRGLSYVYAFTKDEGLKKSIAEALEKSAKNAVQKCDDQMVCSTDTWYNPSNSIPPNVHVQLNILELWNAMMVVANNGLVGTKLDAPSQAPPVEKKAVGDTPGSALSLQFGWASSILAVIFSMISLEPTLNKILIIVIFLFNFLIYLIYSSKGYQ